MDKPDTGVDVAAGPTLTAAAHALLTRLHEGAQVQEGAGLDQLVSLGLAVYDAHVKAYIAAEIRHAERQFAQRRHREIAASLREVEQMSKLVDDLVFNAGGESGGVERFKHHTDVTAAIGQAVDSATSHISTAHPLERPSTLLGRALIRDIALMEKGMSLRVIYLDSARTRRPEQEYAARVTALGAQVRTALPPFERMILVDDRVVFVSDHHGVSENKPALRITHPSLVTLFSRLYEQQWDRAEPWTGEMRAQGETITTPRNRRMLRRLREGHALKAIASELLVSLSTLYADLERLYVATGTSNQFALGIWYAESDQAARERALDQ